MTAQTRTKSRKKLNLWQLLIRAGLILGAIYLCYMLMGLQQQINENVRRTNEVLAQTEEANLRNVMLQETLSQVGTDEFLIRTARVQLRFAMPSDRIYIDAARN